MSIFLRHRRSNDDSSTATDSSGAQSVVGSLAARIRNESIQASIDFLHPPGVNESLQRAVDVLPPDIQLFLKSLRIRIPPWLALISTAFKNLKDRVLTFVRIESFVDHLAVRYDGVSLTVLEAALLCVLFVIYL